MPDRRFVANLSFVALFRIIPRLSGPLLTVVATRILAPDRYGEYVAAVALTAIVTQFLEGGINQLIVRDIAAQRVEARDYASAALALKMGLLLPVLGLLVAAMLLLRYPAPVRPLVYLLAAGIFVGSFGNVFDAVLQGWQRMSVVAAAVSAMSTVNVVLGIPLLIEWRSPLALGVAAVVGYIVYSVVCVVGAARIDPDVFRVRFQLRVVSAFARTSVWFSAAQLVQPLYSRGDAVVLTAVAGVTATGIYGVGYSLLLLLVMPAEIVVTALYPRLAARWQSVEQRIRDDDTLVSVAVLAALGVGAGFVGLLLVPDLLRWIVPPVYWPGARVASVLSVAVPFMFVNRIFDAVIRIRGLLHILLLASVVALFVNLGANVLLDSPRLVNMGPQGAAVSMILSEVCYTLVVSSGLKRTLGRAARLAQWIVAAGLGIGVGSALLSRPLVEESFAVGWLAGGIAVMLVVGATIWWRSASRRSGTPIPRRG